MAPADRIATAVEEIAGADSWNRRIALIRGIPEDFGKSLHQAIYAAIANTVYVSDMVPDFAYIHWRDDYDLPAMEHAYQHAHTLTEGFTKIDADALANAIFVEPSTLRVFRLLLGFTTQEFAASTVITGAQMETAPLSNSAVKSMEGGKAIRSKVKRQAVANMAAAVIDQTINGGLFAQPSGDMRTKINKPDTVAGWDTVRKYAVENVPFPVFLHQRHYGGAFRQLLDATSGKRGNVLEQAVEDLFKTKGVLHVRTGPNTKKTVSTKFGLTVKPAPDFVVHDENEQVKAILECKQANDGGTARDKAARFSALRVEAMRLGGIPVFAVLAGLGWRRTADTLGHVIRDTDGRVFSIKTLDAMMSVEPFPGLIA